MKGYDKQSLRKWMKSSRFFRMAFLTCPLQGCWVWRGPGLELLSGLQPSGASQAVDPGAVSVVSFQVLYTDLFHLRLLVFLTG